MYSQAVHDRASLPTPLYSSCHLSTWRMSFRKEALGHRRVPVHRPAQELELLHHPVPVLGLQGCREAIGGEWREKSRRYS